MPAYFRLNIDGSLCAGAERFSTGFAIRGPVGQVPEQSDLNEWAAAAKAYLSGTSAPAQQLRAMLGATGAITTVRIYYYPEIGDPAALVAASPSAAVAGSGSVTMPPQCALVFSLGTGVPGRRYRGRMYWPIQTTGITSGGKHTAVNQSMADNFGLVLATLASASLFDPPAQPAVVSQVAGAVTPVTNVSVGDVVDTQRRRRDTLIENRYVSPITVL